MIKFLFKGILRDKNRSLLPVIIISIGVALTILLIGFLKGMMGDMVDQNARFQTGHVKVMTKAYAKEQAQTPNDLAILGVDTLVQNLNENYPDYEWVKRINFGGIADAIGEDGESKGQGPASGIAIEIYSEPSEEAQRLNIQEAIVTGRLPQKKNEALIGNDFAEKLKLKIGDELTLMGTTMYGSISFVSFTISGTVRFGVEMMDKGTIIVDIADAQQMLDMENGAGEILGFAKNGVYNNDEAVSMAEGFNKKYQNADDEFAPFMESLRDQNNMGSYLDYVNSFSALFIIIFVIVMSIVLWNTGLIGGLRRYQEFGIRLALGEEKGHIYRTLVYEAVLVGVLGSIVGTAIGITVTLLMQKYGIDISGLVSGGTMMMPSHMKSQFTANLLYIGFIPGLLAMVLGNMLSGIGIYKRETATLFKELEV